MVQQAYANPSVPLDRTLQEIWRAALNQGGEDLGRQLQEPGIAKLAVLASRWSNPAEAAREAGRIVNEEKMSSLAANCARRAAVQSAALGGGGDRFFQRLFAEATNYLVARDLPGHITRGARLATVGAGRDFKGELVAHAAHLAATVQRESVASTDWRALTLNVLDRLRRRKP